ncbi:MAG: hypothetical protein HYR85_05590 [Planctomycetes bacterium]|nr:hypothetical protein [Planctomycetota bacterium]MBI3848273.1 hypothetical protein [Planctomycetota bacterium]
MIFRIHRLIAQWRWLRAPCSRDYVSYWIAGITAVSIAALPFITPYAFGRAWLTRLEIVLAAVQLGSLLLAIASTYHVCAAVLDDRNCPVILVRTIDRDRIAAVSIVTAGLCAARWLIVLAPAAILAGLEGGPGARQESGRDVALADWFCSLAAGYLSIGIQIFAICAFGCMMSLILSPAFGSVATLAVFLISHATVGLAPVGFGSVVSDVAAFVLRFLPHFADLTPANLLDDRGRMGTSNLLIALVHGTSFTVAFAVCCEFLFRRRDL